MHSFMKRPLERAAILALLLPAAASYAGPQHPNVARGFKAESAFQVGEIDNVNLFNGNLALTIPIGQTYPVGGGFSHKLTLVYNSKVWDWELYCPFNPTQCVNLPTPAEGTNAGLGWTLTLGELVPPLTQPRNPAEQWQYTSSDGGEHLFYPTLHPNDTPVAGVSYTRDGSYLRMKQVGSFRDIEYPDGTIHRFDSLGRIRFIKDRLANRLTISYGADLWTLSDGFRTHYVRFENRQVDGETRSLVKQVDLAAFGGARAKYNFFYRGTGKIVERPCPYYAAAIPNNPVGQNALVQLLDVVLLPDGSRYWLRDYQTTQGLACAASGTLTRLQLPTLGHIAWSHGAYRFPTGISQGPGGGGGGPDPTLPEFLTTTTGVTRRTLQSATGAPLGPSWTYAQKITLEGGTNQPVETTTTVIDPENVKTIHYFSAYAGGGTNNPYATIHDYGLPYTPKNHEGAGRFLSMRVHKRGSAALLRTTYLAHERDAGGPTQPGEHGEHLNLNRHLSQQKVVYHDDGGKWTLSEHTQWDGVGHYRRVKKTASSNWPGQKTRFERTNYNVSGMPGTAAAWILNTYNETWQLESGKYASQRHCFDAQTGVLQRTRIRSAASLSSSGNDAMVVYQHDARGNVTLESYHGGDNTTISTSDSCAVGLSPSNYAIRHAYAAGARRVSVYQNAGGGDIGFKSLDLTIDNATGLTSTRRDTAGLATTLGFDTLGRLTLEQPAAGHGAQTQYLYNRAIDAGNLADVRILRRPNNGAGVLHERKVLFDPLGRVVDEQTKLANSTFARRTTSYNVMGWKKTVSEQDASPAHFTRFLDFDEFGRAKTIQPPDGSGHNVTFQYFGVRAINRTVKVQTTGGLQNATTSQAFDNHGRLRTVNEPGGGLSATHTYDVGNRLVTAALSGGGTNQSRQFVYDQRGFMTAEWLPELGPSGTTGAWRRFSEFDARGHATKVSTDGIVTPNLTYTFDRAERVTQIKEAAGAKRELKKFVYGTGNSGGDLRKGKLQQAIRHNYRDNPWTVGVGSHAFS